LTSRKPQIYHTRYAYSDFLEVPIRPYTAVLADFSSASREFIEGSAAAAALIITTDFDVPSLKDCAMHRLGLILVAVVALHVCYSPYVYAQQADANKADAGNADGKDKGDKTAAPPSYLRWMIKSSGPVGAVLFAMSFATIGVAITCIVSLRHNEVIPPEFVDEFEAKLNEKQYQEAYDLARGEDSFIAKILAAGLGGLSGGYEQAMEAIEDASDDEKMRIDHRLSWLAILGTTAPLLGLLGTVQGIIESFQVIANSDVQPKPSLLAAGISTSLFNTFEGLFVAIIATLAFMFFKNRAARLTLDANMTAHRVMLRFSPAHQREPNAATHVTS